LINVLKVVTVLLIIVAPAYSWAQCNCKFTIPAGSGYVNFDGAAKGVKPGDVICVNAGSVKTIQFSNIRGAAGNPVIIKNCGGQVQIGGTSAQNGFLFFSSRYVRLTGTGTAGVNYGFKITATASGSQGIAYAGLSSDVEIDHMEIGNTGYSAMMIKTDPSSNCADQSATRPNFTLYNVSIHDNYIHHTGGEGIYLGDSFYLGTTVFCGATEYCHEVRGVRIFNNRFEHTGREAIQVGAGVADIEINNNSIYNYGSKNVPQQNGGVQLGLGTAARFYNNLIKNGTGPALAIQGIGNEFIYNNVFVNPGKDGAITINTRPTPLSTDIINRGYAGGVYLINNTFVSATTGVVQEFVNAAPGNVMYNNLVVASPATWDKTYFYTDWKKGNNVAVPVLANAKFVNAAADDYRLAAGSPAINAGRDVSAWSVVKDADNKARPAGGANDAGAYEFAGATSVPPVANAGADRTVTLPSNSLGLAGTGTDNGGWITAYSWTKVSGGAATLSSANTSTLNVSGLVAGTYVFRLTVTDNSNLTAFDDITVTVRSAAAAPVANAGADKSITLPTNSVGIAGSGSDSDGSITAYSWTKVSGGAATLSNANTNTVSASGLTAGTYVFRLTVTDNANLTAYDDMTVTVNSAAAAPPASTVVYRINAGSPNTVAGSPVNWVSDTQGSPVSYFDRASLNYTCGATSWTGSNTTGAPNEIFGPNRYTPNYAYAGQLQWNFPLTSGTYQVNLFFAETPYAGGVKTAGARVFSVKMENNTVLSNFDIYATAGMNAVKRSFTLSVTDGTLDMDFVRITGNPQVNGIEIIRTSGSASRMAAPEEEIAAVPDSLSAAELNTTGEEVLDASVDVYPNPFSSEINVGFSSEQKEIAVSFVSLSGQTVFSKVYTGETVFTLDVSGIDLPTGIYVMIITSEKGRVMRKVLKE
jgi:hypothetical protein